MTGLRLITHHFTVRLFNRGLDILEVSDDGSGVPSESRSKLAALHATSKITAYDDIHRTQSLGFRGEALHSLANLSGKLVVATRTQSDAVAQKMEFDRDGKLTSSQSIPRKVGTTVAVMRLFEKVPVRCMDLQRNISRHRTKLIKLMEAYAIFNVGKRIHVMDMVGEKCKEQSILATTQNSSSLRETISSVLGHKHLAALSPIDFEIPGIDATVEGFVSTAGPSAPKSPSTPVQYFCINQRPVALPAIGRALNDAWRTSFGQSKKPSCVLRLRLPLYSYDINISPDKRDAILTKEKLIIDGIRNAVSEQWSSQTNGHFRQQILQEIEQQKDEEEPEPDCQPSPVKFRRRGAFAHDFSKAKLQHEDDVAERILTDEGQRHGPLRSRGSSKRQRLEKPSSVTPSPTQRSLEIQSSSTDLEKRAWYRAQQSFNGGSKSEDIQKSVQVPKKSFFEQFRAIKRVSNDSICVEGSESDVGQVDHLPEASSGVRRVSSTSVSNTTNFDSQSGDQMQRDSVRQVARSQDESNQQVVWDFGNTGEVIAETIAFKNAMTSRRRSLRKKADEFDFDPNETPANTYNGGTMEASGSNTVSLQKDDFRGKLRVVGQFNMGFILALSEENHLWILDQHACDERYNFERLCRETVIREQRLMAPLDLELTPTEEMCVMENIDIFEKNGFRFSIDTSKAPQKRCSLTAIPHSGARAGLKAVQFGKQDVSALCAILNGDETSATLGGGTGTDGSGQYSNNAVRRHIAHPNGQEDNEKLLARLPKAIAMFASRACRSSVMIGTALSEDEMVRIKNRMTDLSHPWQCAHGRPTVTLIANLRDKFISDERVKAEHHAGPTVTMMSQELV